jgi:hypothetical protein
MNDADMKMKKVFFLFLMIAFCGAAQGQIIIALLFGDKLNSGKLEFGLVLSPTFTNITNIESDYRGGLTLGMFFNIRPDRKLFIHVDLIPKSSFGAKNIPPYSVGNDSLDNLFASGSVERIIKTVNMSVLARYTITPHFFIDAGIQPDLLYKPRDYFTVDHDGNELQYTKNIEDQFTRLDFQVAGGLFYRFKLEAGSMGIGMRYTHGITDIDKVVPGIQASSAWQFSLTIPIGAVPKEKSTQ